MWGAPSNSNKLIHPGKQSSSAIDVVRVLQTALLEQLARPSKESRTEGIVAFLKKLDSVDVNTDILSKTLTDKNSEEDIR